jgi:peptidoglycan/xylan/chitin deacetylase (PgdA/CDA1 family)
LLTWEQIDALQQDHICFGSHTCTHPHLPALPTEQIWQELTLSKRCLETKLGQEIPFLAYPYGESTLAIQRLAKTAGYMASFGVATGTGGRFNLWRTECHTNDTMQLFVYKLSRWHRVVTGLRTTFRENTALGQFLHKIKRQHFVSRDPPIGS